MGRKAYRDAFVSAQISGTVAAQISALREKKEWTQTELAKRAGMRQSRISALEDPNYENIEVGTLRRIASAFDVALVVKFAPFSDLAKGAVTLNPAGVSIPSFEDDVLFHPEGTSTNPVCHLIRDASPHEPFGVSVSERPAVFALN